MATWNTAYSEALRRQRKGKTSGEVQSTFKNLIDRGFEGINAAMKGTPYVSCPPIQIAAGRQKCQLPVHEIPR
jgi:hypothetical protein